MSLVIKNGLCLFWAEWPSNWTISPMRIDGVQYNCVEQYMMSMKARLFRDHTSLRQIMETQSPKEQKRLGRQVAGFNTEFWMDNDFAYEIVLRATVEKYRQNPQLLINLQKVGNVEFVEASPVDIIWGIGLGADNPDALDKSKWKGQNLLGKAITQARDIIEEFERDGISVGGGVERIWSRTTNDKFLIGIGDIV